MINRVLPDGAMGETINGRAQRMDVEREMIEHNEV